MPLRLRCSACNNVYSIDEKFAGKKVKCKCGKFFVVPAAAAKPAAATTTPRPATVTKAVSSKPTATAKKPVAAKPVAAPKAAAPLKPTVVAKPVHASPPALAAVDDPFGFPDAAADSGGSMFDLDVASSPSTDPMSTFGITSDPFQATPAAMTNQPAAFASPQFSSSFAAPQAAQADAAPKKLKKPLNYKPLLKIGGVAGGILVVVAMVAGFMYWNSSPTTFATPEACFTEYQHATRNSRWSKQFALLTPETQTARLRMAAQAALPWCKNGPELVEMFGKHGLSEIPGMYREWEAAADSDGPQDPEAAKLHWEKLGETRKKIDQQIVSGPPDKALYYDDILAKIVEFEFRFESNGLYRVNAQRKKKQGRDFITKNKLQNVQVTGDTAVAHIIIMENGE